MVSLENYSQPGDPSHLKLAQGDVIQVTGSTDSGLLEGTLRGQAGYFPRHIVEDLVRCALIRPLVVTPAPPPPPAAAPAWYSATAPSKPSDPNRV